MDSDVQGQCEQDRMRSSTRIAISAIVVILILIVLMIVSNPVEFEKKSSSTTVSRLTVNDTITVPTTITTTLTSTSVSVTTLIVTKNYTATKTSTTILLPAIDPQLVKANAYFLTTPADMMDWNQSSFSSFVQHLINANVTYLYFNLPNINADASLKDNFTLDSSLILRFDLLATSLNHPFQYIGWTGTQDNPNATLGNYTKAGIDETVNSLYKAGFDGILLDLEPVPNDSPQFLSMLTAFRAAIDNYAPGMLLGANSMAVYPGEPYGHEWGWDPVYFQNVSSLLNFISPMLFESGASTLNLYIQYVDSQIQFTSEYTRAAVIYAIPDWYANTTWHNSLSENISNAVIAFQTYLNNRNAPPMMIGLAIFGLNKTYILAPDTATQALETTHYDWSFFVNQWVNTKYPDKIGTGVQ
ncbi:MAG: glycoside hydrolase family 18 protein [Nitrososphaerales archaeon]